MMFTTLGLAAKSKRGHFGILNENMKPVLENVNFCLKMWISAQFLGSSSLSGENVSELITAGILRTDVVSDLDKLPEMPERQSNLRKSIL